MNNERVLISRNKREGWYYGKSRYCREYGWAKNCRHMRTGPRGIISLRYLERGWNHL